MHLRLISRATTPVILSRADAKKYLSVRDTFTDDDTLIDNLIAEARDVIERHNKIYLQEAVIEGRRFGFHPIDYTYVDFWVRPVRGIVSVKYTDTAGAAQTLAATNYFLDTSRTQERLCYNSDVTLPDVKDDTHVVIRLDVGYKAAVEGYATVPELYRRTMYYLVSEWYGARYNHVAEKMSIAERILKMDRMPTI